MSGLLVAPMMKTFFLLPMPSISVRIWLMTLSEAPPASPLVPPLDLAMLSSSSKKRTQGAADLRGKKIFQNYSGSPVSSHLALSNTSRTFASDSPNHMVSSSGPLMEMKLAWHSLAMALASRVLPQPGGP